MYEIVAKDNHSVALVPDSMVVGAYRGGYLRKAKFKSGLNGFKVIVPLKAGPFNGIYIFLQRDYVLLPGGLEGVI